MYKTIDEVPREDIWDVILHEDPEAEEIGAADPKWMEEYISEVVDACRDPSRSYVQIGHWGMFRDSSDIQEDCCDYALKMLDRLDVEGFLYQDMVGSMGVIDPKKLLLLGVRHVDLYEVLRRLR